MFETIHNINIILIVIYFETILYVFFRICLGKKDIWFVNKFLGYVLLRLTCVEFTDEW